MRHIVSGRHECGAVLVVALLMLLMLTILGMAALSNSRIERLIAGNDNVHKAVFASTEHALVLAEATLEQLHRRTEGTEGTIVGYWGPGEQAPWEKLRWDETDSQSTARFFDDPQHPPEQQRPVLPPSMQYAIPWPRYIVEVREIKRDSLTIGMGESTGVWTFNVSVKGSYGPQNTSVMLQSVYAKRYD